MYYQLTRMYSISWEMFFSLENIWHVLIYIQNNRYWSNQIGNQIKSQVCEWVSWNLYQNPALIINDHGLFMHFYNEWITPQWGNNTYDRSCGNTCRSSNKAGKNRERSYKKEKKKRRRIKVQDSSSSGKVQYWSVSAQWTHKPPMSCVKCVWFFCSAERRGRGGRRWRWWDRNAQKSQEDPQDH